MRCMLLETMSQALHDETTSALELGIENSWSVACGSLFTGGRAR